MKMDLSARTWMPIVCDGLAIGAMAAAVGLGAAARAGEGAPPDYGFEWAIIGDPGNRPTNPDEVDGRDLQIGAVDYVFRMSRTEVSAGDWLEFVQAYDPYYTGSRADTAFTGQHIEAVTFNPALPAGWRLDSQRLPDFSTRMSWEYAARYCNWLHNDKRPEQEAFETGVYDTSTFTQNKDGSFNHQIDHSPEARFWIPTLDEWTKAAHWDPDKNGGEGGYWLYPTSSDDPPISGLPEEGGETNAGVPFTGDRAGFSLGQYPHVQSPWGLLDTSGGSAEFTSTSFSSGGFFGAFAQRGSREGFPPQDRDLIWSMSSVSLQFASGGFRLASVLPAPSSVLIVSILGLPLLWRHRHE